MDRKLFNLKNIAIVAVFSLIAFVGFNSFTDKDYSDNSVKTTIVEEWYPLTPTSDDLPSNQVISGGITSEPTGPGCNRLNAGDYCGVKLRFDNVTPPSSYPSGTTVADAASEEGVSIVFEIVDEEEVPVYSRQPE